MDPSSLGQLVEDTFGLESTDALWLALAVIVVSGTVAWAVTKIVERKNSRDIEKLKFDLDAQVRKTQVFLDTSTHVRRAQFEAEFKAYQAIWPKAYWLKEAALVLRPMMENVDTSKTEEERRNEKYLRFRDSYNALLFDIENNAPFYPQAIYELLSEFRNFARLEDIAFEYQTDPRRADYSDYMKKRDDIVASFDRARDAIRARLAEISVID